MTGAGAMAEEDYDVALLEGIAGHLAAGGVGFFDPAGYSPADLAERTPIFYDPEQMGDAGSALLLTIVVDPMWVEHDGAQVDVQIRARMAFGLGVADGMRLQSAVAAKLHRATYLELPTGVHVSAARRLTISPMWRDANHRVNVSSTYRFVGTRRVAGTAQ